MESYPVPERETLVSAVDRVVFKYDLFSLVSRGGQLVRQIIGCFLYRIIICRTVPGASNPFLPFLMRQEMVLYERMVL